MSHCDQPVAIPHLSAVRRLDYEPLLKEATTPGYECTALPVFTLEFRFS